jgi:hypothetical protein
MLDRDDLPQAWSMGLKPLPFAAMEGWENDRSSHPNPGLPALHGNLRLTSAAGSRWKRTLKSKTAALVEKRCV